MYSNSSLTAELVVGQVEPLELVETAELRRDRTCKRVIYVCGGNRISTPGSLFSRYSISVDRVPPTS